MKKYLSIIAIALAASACSVEFDENGETLSEGGKKVAVSINASLLQTESTYDAVNNKGLWEAGATIAVNAGTDGKFQEFTTAEGGDKACFKGFLTDYGSKVYTYKGFAPYKAGVAKDAENVVLAVPEVQYPSGSNAWDTKADILVAEPFKAASGPLQTEGIKLRFARRNALLALELSKDWKDKYGKQQVDKITITSDKPIAGDIEINLNDGTYDVSAAAGNTIEIVYRDSVSAENLVAFASIVPVEGANIKVRYELRDDILIMRREGLTVPAGRLAKAVMSEKVEDQEITPDELFLQWVLENKALLNYESGKFVDHTDGGFWTLGITTIDGKRRVTSMDGTCLAAWPDTLNLPYLKTINIWGEGKKLAFAEHARLYNHPNSLPKVWKTPRLEQLNLFANELDGAMPEGFFDLPVATKVAVYGNNFTSWPSSINLPECTVFEGNEAQLTKDGMKCDAPKYISSPKLARNWLMSFNNWPSEHYETLSDAPIKEWTAKKTGPLPRTLILPEVTDFNISHCKDYYQNTELPDYMYAPKCTNFEVYDNRMIGKLPDWLMQNESLTRLMLFYNYFDSICDRVDLPNVTILQFGVWFKPMNTPSYWNTPKVGEGQASNGDGASFDAHFMNYASAIWSELPETLIHGGYGNFIVPTTITKLPKVLKLARVGRVSSLGGYGTLPNLKGSKMPEVWETPELTWVGLEKSGLEGKFPDGIAAAPKLETVYLEGNNLRGALPHHWASKTLKVIKMYNAAEVAGETCQNSFGYVIPAGCDIILNTKKEDGSYTQNEFHVPGEFLGFERGWGQARFELCGGTAGDLDTWSDTRLFEKCIRKDDGEVKYWWSLPGADKCPRQFVEYTDAGAAAYNATVFGE